MSKKQRIYSKMLEKTKNKQMIYFYIIEVLQLSVIVVLLDVGFLAYL